MLQLRGSEQCKPTRKSLIRRNVCIKTSEKVKHVLSLLFPFHTELKGEGGGTFKVQQLCSVGFFYIYMFFSAEQAAQ